MSVLIPVFALSALVSFISNLAIIRYAKKHNILIDKDSSNKPQRMHSGDIPRAGGIGIIIGIALALCVGVWTNYLILNSELAAKILNKHFAYLLFFIPLGFVFFSGILEDFHNSLSPKMRLLLQTIGVLGAVILFNCVVSDIGFKLPFILAVCFSVFAATGVINAMNIIDGFNGLAGGFSIMAFFSIACVAYIVRDYDILFLSMACIGAVVGFFVLNFPKGRIFLGDGGAYMLGFMLVYLLVKITQNANVSPYYALCVMIYPVFEVLFSMYRRKLMRNASAMQPDSIHLHTLIFKRITRSNYKTSVMIWALNIPFVFLPVLFFNNFLVLIALIAVFVVLYCFIYFKIISFKNVRL